MGSSDDLAFGKKADAFMEHVLGLLENEDPDELDPDLAMGVLSIEFAEQLQLRLAYIAERSVLRAQRGGYPLVESDMVWQLSMFDGVEEG